MFAMFTTAAFADQNTGNQMDIMKMQETMLTNYQRLLKQMMENELNSYKK